MPQSKQTNYAPQHKTLTDAKLDKKQYRETFTTIAKALGHPIRLEIIDILKKTKDCICGDIVNQLPLSQATVSQHLKVLKNAGLIRGNISGPATCYCLESATIKHFKKLLQKL